MSSPRRRVYYPSDWFGAIRERSVETFAALPPPVVFADSFEFGALSAWSSVIS